MIKFAVLSTILGLVGAGLFLHLTPAPAQTATNPAPSAAACAYNASPPTGSTGTFIIVQCDSSGRLQVH